MLQQIEVELITRTQPHIAPCFVTKTPGLVVHRYSGFNKNGKFVNHRVLWGITHQRSGYLVTFVEGPEEAMFLAEELGKLNIDWTDSGVNLRALYPSRPELIEMVKKRVELEKKYKMPLRQRNHVTEYLKR
jgi:hypothetical protein